MVDNGYAQYRSTALRTSSLREHFRFLAPTPGLRRNLGLSLGDDDGNRDWTVMGQRDMPGGDTSFGGDFSCTPFDPKYRYPGVGSINPDVMETESAKAEAEGLHRRLAGTEPGGERWDRIRFRRHVRQLGFDEQPSAHRGGPRQRLAKPIDIYDIHSDTNHGVCLPACRRPVGISGSANGWQSR
jgi:hypothetical protein